MNKSNNKMIRLSLYITEQLKGRLDQAYEIYSKEFQQPSAAPVKPLSYSSYVAYLLSSNGVDGESSQGDIL
jgi:hypothetical protein